MFLFRLLYGYVEKDAGRGSFYASDFFSSRDMRKNYASEKIKMNDHVLHESNLASNQKFEKTAKVKTKTSEFEKDEKNVKTQTKAFNAIIQYEQNEGQKGNRELHLLIGVNPTLFDSFYVQIQKIGSIKELEITKIDKTNEYKQLNAKKKSIENTLASLKELKSKGGQITDFVALNDKILEVEEKLQELGVELGNFDAENEFCSIKFSMYEGATEKDISLIHRVKVAFEWAVKYFAILSFILLIMTITIFVILLIIDRLQIISAISKKVHE
jgi:hypothetical protein